MVLFSSTGIRSVSFREDVLTVGTGGGSVYFYDLRAGKYLDLKCGHKCSLTVGEGWLVSVLFHFFSQNHHPPPTLRGHKCSLIVGVKASKEPRFLRE